MSTIKIEVVRDCEAKSNFLSSLDIPSCKGDYLEYPSDSIRITGLPDKVAKYRALCERMILTIHAMANNTTWTQVAAVSAKYKAERKA